MFIIQIGNTETGSTSSHRAAALQRLGHEVLSLPPSSLIGIHSFLASWLHYRTGYRLLQHQILNRLMNLSLHKSYKPGLIWIDCGEYFGPTIVNWLRSTFNCPVLLYCNDDPTGQRDWPRYALLRKSFPYYDLCVYRREINELEWLALGARRVLRVWMSYDESIHSSTMPTKHLNHNLLFVGTNIPAESRDSFLISLIRAHIPLSIFGARWSRSRHWSELRSSYCGGSLADHHYAEQLANSLLCLGMLSNFNRDLHTRRSVEVTAAGSTLLAERTSEHELLYEEGVEALFWSSVEECIRFCKYYHSHPELLRAIQLAGHSRVLSMGVGNEDICRQILSCLHDIS